MCQKGPFSTQLLEESPLCEDQCLFQLQEELALQGLRGDLAHDVAVKFVKNGPFGSCNLPASVVGCASAGRERVMAADDTHQRGESGSPADELLQAVIQDLSQGLLEGRVPPDETGITLLVGGMLVSGYLTTSEAYCQGTFRRDADFIRALVARLTGEPVSTEEPPLYIHLRDVQIWSSPLGRATHVPWWRGRLRSVDGFALGEVQGNNARPMQNSE